MKKFISFLLTFLAILGLSYSLEAYSFGKNKVQYRRFNWHIVETEHFRIFYCPEIKSLLPFASSVLEETFDEYSKLLSVNNFSEKIPVLIYSSPNSFKQTNVTLEVIDEFTGGFTEVFKNRVVVPFNGSWADFKHVLRHELVHVFQFNIFLKGSKYYKLPIIAARLPLWFMEGMAEYLSRGGWSPDAIAYIRDLLFNDKVVPVSELENYVGYIDYKEGQAIFCFIEEQYGKEKVREFIYNMKMSGSLNDAFKKTLGKDVQEVDKEFMVYLKRKFYKDVQDFEFPTCIRMLTQNGGFLNFGVISPDGGYVALLSDRSGFTNIYLVSAFDGHVEKKLVSGERSPSFENLHLIRPGFSFSPDGGYLIFPASKGGTDAIYQVDIRSKDTRKLIDPGLEAIYEPTFSPDGSLIAFTGIKDGKSDIFIYNTETGSLEKLTDDPWDDRNPHFSKDGKKLFFVSDRCEDADVDTSSIWLFGSYAVFAYSFDDSSLERITPRIGEIGNIWAVNDSILLLTTWHRNSENVFAFNIKTRKFFAVTDYPTEIKLISADSSAEQLAFSLMWNGRWQFAISSEFQKDWREIELEEVPPDTVVLTKDFVKERRYRKHFTLDWLQGTMSYDSDYGFSGWLVVGLSDELGNHRLTIATDRFSDNTNLLLTYASLGKRVDWEISVYNYWIGYYQDYETLIYKRHTGIGLQLSYPLDKFKRFDLSGYIERPRLYKYTYYPELSVFLPDVYDYYSLTVVADFVIDRALYTIWGPLAGDRGAVEFQHEFSSVSEHTALLFDYRWYWRTSKRSTWAWRFMGGRTWGRWKPTFWVGGAFSLRGYPFYAFNGNNMVLLNSELRVPFIDELRISFPIPLTIGDIRGVLFFDIGAAWNDEDGFRAFRQTSTGGVELEDLAAGAGYGLRLYLAPGVALRFDIAKKANFLRVYGPTRYYLSIDFDY